VRGVRLTDRELLRQIAGRGGCRLADLFAPVGVPAAQAAARLAEAGLVSRDRTGLYAVTEAGRRALARRKGLSATFRV
jgi:hypothetical protein